MFGVVAVKPTSSTRNIYGDLLKDIFQNRRSDACFLNLTFITLPFGYLLPREIQRKEPMHQIPSYAVESINGFENCHREVRYLSSLSLREK